MRASIIKDDRLAQHPCGVHPQTIPCDPVTGFAAIPYDAAEELGYLKVDFLHLTVYSLFKSRAEINDLVNQEPNWTLLLLDSTHPKLFQLSKHGEMLKLLRPKSVEELADCMALIRPGKKNFIGLYSKDKVSARRVLYAKDDSGYSFKKSHALAYAYVCVLQLHLIEQGRL